MSDNTITTKQAMAAAERAIAAGDRGEMARTLAVIGAFFEMLQGLKGIESYIVDKIDQDKFDIEAGERHPAITAELKSWKDALNALKAGERVAELLGGSAKDSGEVKPPQDNSPANEG
ncbi:hypothetical protein [Methylobacterium gnaphalii]|uniref:Uncharacterized protein n=1 Tax=Methylobacterium gnaphalii TaxID=1010610 RepID=A0A512JP94_9HYPH|nr:hypothetical protein [Methylobacterium gnaphalii]GEP11771.1 hypothetical protein MGN01_36160 [Methylobacterium gnaphalii]GJD69447.1 hypothetical protein MMMDOFMJ_2378 [Methylobacterium gnaphalii]GLS49594.1 hypothetical protein GCM10007885_24430 [Methylobacterium gnaphalii]